MTSDKPSDLFLGLVYSLQMSAWMAMGKVLNPMTQKLERDLDQAHETIDLLGMLEDKTRGNLHADESRMLTRVLYELRLNYVEEMKAQPDAVAADAAPETPPGGTAAAQDAKQAPG